MKTKCGKCQNEYEKTSDAIFCQSCQAKTEMKVYETMQAVFSVFGYIFIGMFLPLLIIPLINGTEDGYFIISKKRSILRATPFALLMFNVLNAVLIIAFFRFAKYFKQQFENAKAKST